MLYFCFFFSLASGCVAEGEKEEHEVRLLNRFKFVHIRSGSISDPGLERLHARSDASRIYFILIRLYGASSSRALPGWKSAPHHLRLQRRKIYIFLGSGLNRNKLQQLVLLLPFPPISLHSILWQLPAFFGCFFFFLSLSAVASLSNRLGGREGFLRCRLHWTGRVVR